MDVGINLKMFVLVEKEERIGGTVGWIDELAGWARRQGIIGYQGFVLFGCYSTARYRWLFLQVLS